MNKTVIVAALGLALAPASWASPHPIQPKQSAPDQLVERAIAHERTILKGTIAAKPLVETYLQFSKTEGAAPVNDLYSLAELRLGGLNETQYQTPTETSLYHRIFGIITSTVRGTPEKITDPAFADMLTPDAKSFNAKTYRFTFVRNQFLGSRLMAVYNVMPARHGKDQGRFMGRIWIDRTDAVIARFTGVFMGSRIDGRPRYLHFDSWRMVSDKGVWRPYAIYIQDRTRSDYIHGQIHLWGYHLDRIVRDDESSATSITVDDAVNESQQSPTVSPLEALANWRQQATDNVLDRLTSAGLLAPAGRFTKILDQIATNILITNDIDLQHPIHCRVLLTLPVEETVIGNTILLSKGLIDTMPTEASLASAIAIELAHVRLGHQIDTRFAFFDRLEFSNSVTYDHLDFAHSAKDDEAAAKLADKLLEKSPYKDKLANVADYYAVFAAHAKSLPALTHGHLGDSLLDAEGKPWIAGVLPSVSLAAAERQSGFVPSALYSVLNTNPWTDRVSQTLPRIAPTPGSPAYSLEVLPVWVNFESDQQIHTTTLADDAQ